MTTDEIKSEITLKEVFERVVSLETKFDMAKTENKDVTRRFRNYVYLMSFFLLTDTLLLFFMLYRWPGSP